MPQKKKTTHQPFEGSYPRGNFTKITHEMQSSKAWNDLNLRQQALYLHLKSKYRQTVVRGIVTKSNRDDISLPRSEWYPKLYGDYRTFSADIHKLEDHGFIHYVRYGKATHQCNLYGFTADWIDWKP